MEMVDKENIKEMVGKPPPQRSAREKEKKKPDKEKKKPDPLLNGTNVTTQHHDITDIVRKASQASLRRRKRQCL
jgi:hypothetical protein